MTPHDEQTIRDWWRQGRSEAVLTLSPGEGEAGASLAEFCDRLQALAPGLLIRRPSDELFRAPALIAGRHQNIAFQAVPAERELPPFLAALGQAAAASLSEPDVPAAAADIRLPTDLTLFIAMQCPHCPRAANQLIALAGASPYVRLTLVDGVLFREKARSHAIRTVPTLILEERIRWTGTLKMEEIVEQCVRRDPAQLSAASLRQIIETGEAPRLAAMMAEHGRIFPALTDLLCDERWSVRLGAMVTMEYLCDETPELAADFMPLLQERFGRLGETIQVDVVQVLAQIKSKDAKEWLEGLTSEDIYPSVREAAAEELALWPKSGE